jgi:hypothetical protein
MEDNIQEHINKLLTYMTDEAYKPLTVQELEEALKIEDSADFKNVKAWSNGKRTGGQNEKQSLRPAAKMVVPR